MKEVFPRNSPFFLVCIVVILAVLLAGLMGFYWMFSTVRYYDDEGFMLSALGNFQKGFSLYDQVTTMYGPAYFLVHSLIYKALGAPIDHSSIRFITLFFWIAGCALLSISVYRFTRFLPAALIALFGCFFLSEVLTYEPGHPQALLYLCLCLALFLIFALKRRGIPFVLGVLAALCVFSKVNMGVFFIVSLVWVVLCTLKENSSVRRLRIIAMFALIAMPIVLFFQRADMPTVFVYALVGISVNLNLVLSSPKRFDIPPVQGRQIGGFILGFILTAAVSLAFVLLRGSSLKGVFDGMVVQHMHYSNNYFVSWPQTWMTWKAYVMGFAAVAGCYFYNFRLSEQGKKDKKVVTVIVAAQSVFAVIVVFGFLKILPGGPFATAAPFLMPWAWLIMVVPEREKREVPNFIFARYCFLAIASLQFFIAYPVAGSQLVLSIFLLIPLGCILLSDFFHLVVFDLDVRKRFKKLAYVLVYGLTGLVFLNIFDMTERLVKTYYEDRAPTVLLGTKFIRLPERTLTLIEGVVLNVSANARTLWTIPGLYSYNLWSGVPTPTLHNQSNWPYLFSDAKQGLIKTELEKSPGLVVILQKNLLKKLEVSKARGTPFPPLINYFREKFSPVAYMGPYEIWAPKMSLSNFRLIGGWWLPKSRVGLSESENAYMRKYALRMVQVSLPVLERKIFKIALVDMKFSRELPLWELPDGTFAFSQDPERGFTRLKKKNLEEKGVDLRLPRRLVFFAPYSKRFEIKQFYIIRVYDRFGNVVFRLPFVSPAFIPINTQGD